PDIRVVPGDADLVLGIVELGALVLHVRRLAQDAEAVREAGRDVELVTVVSGEDLAGPFPEGRGIRPDVHRDVEDLAEDRPYELPLRLVELSVKPAQDVARREGVVVLDERQRDPVRLVLLLVVGFEEEAARVLPDDGLDEDDLLEARRLELDLRRHLSSGPARGARGRTCPPAQLRTRRGFRDTTAPWRAAPRQSRAAAPSRARRGPLHRRWRSGGRARDGRARSS